MSQQGIGRSGGTERERKGEQAKLEEGETERGEETDLPQTNDNVLLDQIGLGAGRDLDGESREDTLDVGCVDGDLQRQRTRTENKQLSSSLVLMGG
jgi:hypothetical protein